VLTATNYASDIIHKRYPFIHPIIKTELPAQKFPSQELFRS